jgi:hypothetical protein
MKTILWLCGALGAVGISLLVATAVLVARNKPEEKRPLSEPDKVAKPDLAVLAAREEQRRRQELQEIEEQRQAELKERRAKRWEQAKRLADQEAEHHVLQNGDSNEDIAVAVSAAACRKMDGLYADEDNRGLAKMQSDGSMWILPSGTRIDISGDHEGLIMKVLVLDGKLKGKSVWVSASCIKKVAGK